MAGHRNGERSDPAQGAFFAKNYAYYDGSGHNNGNILSITDTLSASRNQTFTYDSLNRIKTGAQADNSFNLTFSYDPWSNMTESGTSNFPPMGFDLTNRVNQSTSCTPNLVPFCYDAAGDMLMDNHNHAFSYDGEARIETVDGTAAAYTYNALGNRVRKDAGSTSAEYFFFAGNVIAELNPATGVYTDYIFGYGKRVAKDTSSNGTAAQYYHEDQIGSARVMTDASGTKIMDCTFNPFGEQVVCSPDNASNHYRFSGKEYDSESQLDDFGARYYGASMARFIQPDPLLNSGHPWNPQSWDRYTYALNNPLRILDPTGLYNLENSCDSGDKKCNKQFEQHAKDLKKGLSDLQKKVDNMKHGAAKDRLSASLKALGTENDGNNVNVKFGAVQNGAAHTDLALDASGTKIGNFTVTFDSSKIDSSNDYAIDGAHEGTHITNFSDPRYASGGLTDFSDEYRAYQTSAWAAQALGIPNLSFNGNMVWNDSWKEADRQTLMDKGITKEVTHHYHYPETKPHDPWPGK